MLRTRLSLHPAEGPSQTPQRTASVVHGALPSARHAMVEEIYTTVPDVIITCDGEPVRAHDHAGANMREHQGKLSIGA